MRSARRTELTFTTPTVRLLSAEWYRPNDRFDGPAVIALRFNQPVRPEDVAAHVRVALTPHAWIAPALKASARARWRLADRAGLARFDAKVAAVRRVTSGTDAVAVRLAGSWDERQFPPAPTLVVLETTTAPPPESWLTVTIDGAMPSLAGRETPPAHSAIVKLEPAFFVTGTSCPTVCEESSVPSIRLTRTVEWDVLPPAVTVTDVTNGAGHRAVIPVRGVTAGISKVTDGLSLSDIGFDHQPPVTTWRARFEANLTASDGQTLGYPWTGFLQTTHALPIVNLGGTVWEAGGGPLVTVHTRNVPSLTQWIAPVTLASVMPRLLASDGDMARLPLHRSRTPRITLTADAVQKHGLDVSRALSPAGTGLVWATISAAATLGQSEYSSRTTARALLQITNLGISVKDSPQSTLVFVTRLDSGLPVRDARVAIVDQTNVTRWRGTTDGDGVALVPALALRSPDDPFDFRFIVTAEKDGDAAFVDSHWGREANLPSTHRSGHVNASGAALRGTVFADRGVYKESEEVHLKAVLREDTPTGMRLLPPGSALDVVVRNAYRVEVDRRRIAVNRWSSAEWTWQVPEDAWALGRYSIELSRAGTRRPDEAPRDVEGSFVVAAFPQPTFRVDATLTADPPVLGSTLQGTVVARFLAGGALGARPLRWSWLQDVVQRPPPAILERYPPARYAVGYLPESRKRSPADERLPQHTGLLGTADATIVALTTVAAGDLAYSYTFEVDVEDESGHHIASRAGLVVHPASLYVALSRLPKFVDTTKAGQTVGVAAVDLSGRPVADVPVTVSLVREQWVPSDRQRSGWERREISAGEWTVRTATGETPLPIPLGESGRYVLRAIAHDAAGRRTRTEFDFYALGPDLSSWRSEGNLIYLTPERETWKAGETARILIQSPWPRATALVTVEREGVRSHRVFTITSTQDTVDVPITAADAPNVYVSVMLVRGRTSTGQVAEDAPSFRVGYTELSVVDPAKRLRVDVSADRDEYPPGGPATIAVAVTPSDGKPAPAEVTLWAIDQALLSLTDYTTPDLLKAIYTPTPLQVMTTDNRQQLVSRGPMRMRMIAAGACCGVEGALLHGSLSLEGMLAEARRRSARDAFMAARQRPGVPIRQDFRPLVFWLGSVVTDATGRATTTVTLPDSLTTYRFMAVAGNEASQFGLGEREIRVTHDPRRP